MKSKNLLALIVFLAVVFLVLVPYVRFVVQRQGLDADLQATGLGDRFLATRTINESPSKPHPGMVLEILDELGVTADEAVVVGDTTHDLRMAANAGVTGVAVCSGSHPRDELLALEPATCLESAAELPAWLADGAA